MKFYQVKQLKENSTENSAEKDFTEDSKLNENWNISTKLKRKKNTQIERSFFFSQTLSQISSCKSHLNVQHFIFSITFLLVSFV